MDLSGILVLGVYTRCRGGQGSRGTCKGERLLPWARGVAAAENEGHVPLRMKRTW